MEPCFSIQLPVQGLTINLKYLYDAHLPDSQDRVGGRSRNIPRRISCDVEKAVFHRTGRGSRKWGRTVTTGRSPATRCGGNGYQNAPDGWTGSNQTAGEKIS